MARQKTKAVEELEEKVTAVTEQEQVNNEVTEAPTEEKNEADSVEGETPTDTVTDEVSEPAETEEPVSEGETPTDTVTDEVGEPAEEEEPAPEGETPLSAEETLKLAEDIKEKGEKFANINDLTPKTAELVKKELERVNELEAKLKADIAIAEKEFKKENKASADRLFRRGFGDFWNGVSSGWDN